jgi:hypothetical protein
VTDFIQEVEMRKKIGVVLILIAASLACNLPMFAEPAINVEEELKPDEEFEKNLIATQQGLETKMAEATVEAAALETPTPSAAGNLAEFCAIYQELVDDVVARTDEYADIVGSGGDPGDRAEQIDIALEGFYDRLVPPAPPEIRPQVESIADMSLIGLFSSPDPIPAAESLIDEIDAYAAENCDTSFSDTE